MSSFRAILLNRNLPFLYNANTNIFLELQAKIRKVSAGTAENEAKEGLIEAIDRFVHDIHLSGQATNSRFYVSILFKNIDLLGEQIIDPSSGKHFRFSQQLPCLRFGPLKGSLSRHGAL